MSAFNTVVVTHTLFKQVQTASCLLDFSAVIVRAASNVGGVRSKLSLGPRNESRVVSSLHVVSLKASKVLLRGKVCRPQLRVLLAKVDRVQITWAEGLTLAVCILTLLIRLLVVLLLGAHLLTVVADALVSNELIESHSSLCRVVAFNRSV